MNGIVNIARRQASSGGGATPVNPDFVSTWDTTQAGSASDTIVLPMIAGPTVHWGDGSSDTTNTHTYASGGVYTVTIEGAVTTFRFAGAGDRLKILDVSNWGGFDITSDRTFQNCSNLDVTATDAPTITSSTIAATFYNCTSLTTPNFGNWDTSSVNNMYQPFRGCTNFNGQLDGWVHSGVTNIREMLSGCTAFNQNLDTWDVSGITVANDAFRNCHAFNGSVAGWVMKGTWRYSFAYTATAFVGTGANTWDTSGVTDMFAILFSNVVFDQNIASWDINQVTNLGFLISSTLSTANYDALLIAWDAQGAMSYSGTVNFGGSKYTSGGAAETARTSLIAKWGGITDGGAA